MYLCARAIPAASATDPTLKVNFNPITSTLEVIRFAAKSRTIFLSLLGISWFWLVGALILAQLPAYARDVLGGDKTVYTLLLAAFSIGTALGSLACERLSGHKVEIGLVPFGSIGMTVCLLSLYFSHPDVHEAGAAAVSWKIFLAAGGWSVALDCALIGVFGGLFIVPLYALILQRSSESHRARIIACNNIMNAGFMVLAALLAIGWLEVLHFSIPELFILAAVLNAVVAAYIYTLVPEFLMRFLSWIFVNVMYRIKVRGLENIPETGPALIVSNHVSFMDPLVIGGNVRRPIRFVMDHHIFNTPVSELHLPHRAGDSDRAGSRRPRSAAEGLRSDRRRARRRRNCLHFSRGQAHETWRAERVQERRGEDSRAPAGAGGAHGAARPVWQLLQPAWRQGADDPAAAALLVAHRGRGHRARARHAASAEGLQKIVAGLRGEWQ